MKESQSAERTVTVDRTIEKLPRLLQGQDIVRTQRDWSYGDVVNLLFGCGPTEFRKLDENLKLGTE